MINYAPNIQPIVLTEGRQVDVLRLDNIHPIISGNKWFKLKHNLDAAMLQNKKTILTFGGAHSNHLAATAEACKQYQINCIAVVRGEEPSTKSDTLLKAEAAGTQLHFVSRAAYQQKTDTHFVNELKAIYGDFYLIPEGGSNAEGISGCMDILKPMPDYDYVCCAVGSGATFTGLVAAANKHTVVIGMSVLKGENRLVLSVNQDLAKLFGDKHLSVSDSSILQHNNIKQHCLINDYAFSGFAAYDPFLADYKTSFEKSHGFALDYLYTNKLFYGLEDLLSKQKIPANARILAIHSGGLQGNAAFEKRYGLV